MKDEFDKRTSPTSNPATSLEAPQVDLCAKQAHGCYVAFTPELGIQAPDYITYLTIKDALAPRDWTFGFYPDLPKEIPQEYHYGTVLTEILVGYPAPYMAQKGFSESSFRADALPAGAKKDVAAYGWVGLKPDATVEGLFFLKSLPAADQLRLLVPEMDLVERVTSSPGIAKFKDGVPVGQTLENLRTDPIKAPLIGAAYNRYYIDNFEEKSPETPLTTTHTHQVHFFGPTGMQAFIEGLSTRPDDPAYMMYKEGAKAAAVQNNPAVFFDSRTKDPRSFREVDRFFAEDKGLQDYPIKPDGKWPDRYGLQVLTGEQAQARYEQTGGKDTHFNTAHVYEAQEEPLSGEARQKALGLLPPQ